MLCTFAFMGFLGFGSRSYATKGRLPNQRLFLDVSGCPNKTVAGTTPMPESSTYSTGFFETSTVGLPDIVHWKDKEYSGLATFFSLSDLWYPAVGCIMVVFLGLLFSLIITLFSKEKPKPIKSRLFIPLILKMWVYICPNQMSKLVDFDEDELQGRFSFSFPNIISKLQLIFRIHFHFRHRQPRTAEKQQ